MSKSKKAHKRKVKARNERIVHLRRKHQVRQSGPIPNPHYNPQAFIANVDKTIITSLQSDIIRKLKSMENKKEEGKQVSMNGQAENAAAAQTPATPEPVYKIVPETYNKLGAYLLTRPVREVKVLYTAFFRHGQKDPFYKQHAINALVDYLTQCPMGEVEGLLDELEKGGLQQYMPEANPVAGEKPAEKKDGEAPAAQ